MSRESLSERLHEMKRQPFPRCSMERLGIEIVPDDDATWADLIEQHVYRDLIDRYLRGFVAPGDENRCPCCDARSLFGWGLAHGHGSCSCGWPATLLHYVYDRREDPDLVCEATINGHRVCEAPRGEHVDDGRLRCPSPTTPPGLRSPITSGYRPPVILRMTRLLWAHPYAVRLT